MVINIILDGMGFQSTHLREVRQKSNILSNIPPIFQSTHLREVRREVEVIRDKKTGNFNPRTYVRCDHSTVPCFSAHSLFQSTHLREVRPPLGLFLLSLIVFQSTHLREVRQWYVTVLDLSLLFQSTHLREVRLLKKEVFTVNCFISIHAPTWGATGKNTAACLRDLISIHAPTWGATCIVMLFDMTIINFNPRTYVRCDKRIDCITGP